VKLPVAIAKAEQLARPAVSTVVVYCREPPGTRTPNPLIKSQLLCQLS
jgi:hypothetical protein